MMKRAFVLGILLVFPLAACVLADSVETWDGLLFEGNILTGLPDVFTMDNGGVSVTIRRTAILDIAFTEGTEVARVTTVTGKTFEDRVLTTIGTVTIRTESGQTEIPNTQIKRIRFPYAQTESPPYDTTAYLVDGRSYEGNLTAAFPDTISIESGGITSNVRTSQIIALELGDISRIETRERTYQGTIVSSLPETIELGTKYGVLAIKRLSISRLALSAGAEEWTPAVIETRNAFGVGGKMLSQIGFVILHLRFGSFIMEGGLGLSGGVLVYDALLRFRVGLVSQTLYLYAGGGAIGGLGAIGVEAIAGGELSLRELTSLPLVFLGGPDFIYLGGVAVAGWHLGLRWEF
jgi:hypothetical protein